MTFTFRMSCACATIAISFCAGPANAQQFPSKPPAPGPVRVANFPPFKESRLSNGLRMVVVERRNAPVVSVSMSVPAGQSRDLQGRNGLAQLVAGVLEKGAGTRSAEEIAATLDRIGGSIGASVDMDYLTVFGTSLTPAAPQLFEIFADVVARPTFPEKEIELSRSNLLAGLQMGMSQPATMAALTLASTIYPNHPYGQPLLPQTVQALKRDDLVAFHRDNFRPDGALLVVSGDIDQATATSMAERMLKGWTGKARAMEIPAPASRSNGFEILLVNRPGSVQSTLLLGNVTALPTDQHRIASTVMDRIIGGGATARLFNILREKHGWTYGAYTNLSWLSGMGFLTASADVRTEVTDSAAAVLLQEMKRMRDEPVSATELTEARDALTGIFPLKVQTAEQVAAQVRSMKLQELPDSWLPTYRTKISEVTAADVQAAARKYIRPENGVLVVVGDAPKVIEGLRKIAPVRTVDIFGKPVDLAASAPKASAVRIDPARLVAFRDSSTMKVQGNPMGYRVTAITREGSDVRFKEDVSLAGGVIQQNTDVLMSANGLPKKVTLRGKMQGQDAAVDIDYTATHAKGTAITPSPQGLQTVKVDTEIPAGTWDDNAASSLIAALPWSPGAKFTVPVLSSGKGTVSMWTYEAKGTEKVTVPAGTFDAYRVELTGSQQPATLFITTAQPHRIVKLIGGGGQLEQVLEK